jgi:histone-lysine N-methyltransferase SETMAR
MVNPDHYTGMLRSICATRKVYDVLLSHDNTGPYTNKHTTEAITKFGWTLLLHVPHSPNLAPSNFHLFGTLKDSL